MRNYTDGQSGQVLLITLLVLSVVTTVVLSLISRSTTDVNLSSQNEESSRAFYAAEAGVEEALKTGANTSGVVTLSSGDQVTYQADVTTIGGSSDLYVFPNKTTKAGVATFWLANHNNDGTLVQEYTEDTIDVCWSSESVVPAAEISVFYKTSAGAYQFARSANDPDTARRATNNFAGVTATSDGCGSGGTNTTYKQTLTFSSMGIDSVNDTLLMLRLRPLYNDTLFALETPGGAGGVIPEQGNRIESVGSTSTGIARKIVVYQQYRTPDSIFDYSIYSQGSFIQ